MPASRDRLVRRRGEEPMTPPIFARRSNAVGSIWVDAEQEEAGVHGGRRLYWSPVMRTRGGSLLGSSPLVGRGSVGVTGNRFGGQENRRLVGNGRRGGSVLPSWYPRRALQDVTSVVDAVERRRARLRGAEGRRQLDSPSLQRQLCSPALGVPLEHQIFLDTPKASSTKNLQRPGSILANSDFMTPQKKLLNSIDQVEKVMTEEFKRLRRTPSAKRAERGAKVRTLMSMR